MTTLREAAQEALNALNLLSDEGESKFPGTIQGAISDLEDALAQPSIPQRVVDEQAEDEGLWFRAETAAEAYLQQALRRLHAAVEGKHD